MDEAAQPVERLRLGDSGTEAAVSLSGSLHTEVLSRLRDYIVEGNLAAGARVPERQLCDMLGVSRTPLREALKVLAAEGLVELLPNRGARVRYFTETDIRNLFEVVGGLEILAARLACERITPEEIGHVEKLHYEMYTQYMRRDLHAYFQLNQQIHAAIIRAAGNPVLEATFANISARIRRVRYSANMSKSDRWSRAMREHEEILDALSRRAGQELGEILFLHMKRKCDAACEFLRGEAAKATSDVATSDIATSDVATSDAA